MKFGKNFVTLITLFVITAALIFSFGCAGTEKGQSQKRAEKITIDVYNHLDTYQSFDLFGINYKVGPQQVVQVSVDNTAHKPHLEICEDINKSTNYCETDCEFTPGDNEIHITCVK